MRLGQVEPDLETACGADPSFICRQVLDWTGSRGWAEAADILFARPLKIVIVLVAAWLVAAFLKRVINRSVATLAGPDQPGRRLKRRLGQTPIVSTLPGGMLGEGAVSLRATARAETLGHVLRSIAAFAVWTIAGLTVLGELGINLGPLVAGAGIVGVALGFGAQSLVKDFLAGIFVILEDQYGVGDTIDLGEISGTEVGGTVESVSLRSTRLLSDNGTVWHVPNGAILRVENVTQQRPETGPPSSDDVADPGAGA